MNDLSAEAVLAYFSLVRTLDDLMDAPATEDALEQLTAVAEHAHATAMRADLLEVPAHHWWAFIHTHPDYLTEQRRHQLAVQRRTGTLLEGVDLMREMRDVAYVARWLGDVDCDARESEARMRAADVESLCTGLLTREGTRR